MGSCGSRPGSSSDEGQHPQHAPMWVVPVENVIEMTGALQPHHALKAAGLLEIRRPKMFTLFVSHQWLGWNHPDPNGEKLRVLQLVLKKLMAKQLTIEYDLVSQFFGGKLAEFDETARWYMWLDYFCVPQQGQAPGDVRGYISSIPSYVELCNAFIALVPPVLHSDTGVACDMHSWLQRGWCRTELWCYFLSTRNKLPVIEVRSPDAVKFTVPMWHRYPVHSGDFGIAADRVSCAQVIEMALAKYVADVRQRDKTRYRLYLSLFEEVAGLQKKCRSLDEFLSDFDFVKPLQQHKGLGPVACAALSGDEGLVRQVLTAKALVQTRAPTIPETLNLPDFTPLHLALWFRSHDLSVVETLLELRADPNDSTINVSPPLGLCRTVEVVDLLVRKGAGVNFAGKQISQYFPLHNLAGNGAPTEALARLLELRADVRGGKRGLASQSPLHNVVHSGDSKNDLRNAQLLVENGADVNQVVKPEGSMRMLELMYRAYGYCRSEPGLLTRFFSHMSATPLGWCALFGNHGLLVFLLRARADPEIRDNRGRRPLDIATCETVRAILKDPSSHIYLPEDTSDFVTETL